MRAKHLVSFAISLGMLNQPVGAAPRKRTQTKQSAKKGETCEEPLLSKAPLSKAMAELRFETETRSLLEITQDNFVAENPFWMADASSLYLAMLKKSGKMLVKDPLSTSEPFYIWKGVHNGGMESSGLRVVGQFKAVSQTVAAIESGLFPLLLGGSGTGKSEISKVMQQIGSYRAKHDESFKLYKYQWKNLEAIPKLRKERIVRVEKDELPDGTRVNTYVYRETREESPVTLLPESIRDRLYEISSAKIEEVSGRQTFQEPERSKQNDYIYKAILAHHIDDIKTDDDIVKIIDNYVDVKRFAPSHIVLDNQPDEVNWATILGDIDPMSSLKLSQSHPFYYQETGKMVQGHLGSIFLDEILRNKPSFLHGMLGVINDGEVNQAGYQVKFDSVLLAATNNESLAEVEKKGNLGAFIDRSARISYQADLRPYVVANTLLYTGTRMDKGLKIYERKLELDEYGSNPNEFVHSNINNLFPILPEEEGGYLPLQEAAGNYAVRFGHGDSAVDVYPHLIEAYAAFVAMTRYEISPETIGKVSADEKFGVAGHQIVRNPVFRSQFMMGKKKDFPYEFMAELELLSGRLDEGDAGISAREAWIVFSKMLTIARKPANKNVLTKEIMYSVLKEELGKGSQNRPFKKNSDKEITMKWQRLLDMYFNDVLVSEIRKDILSAIGGGVVDNVNKIYSDIVLEIIAITKSPTNRANKFKDGKGQSLSIDFERLEKIQEIMNRSGSHPLVFERVAEQHQRMQINEDTGEFITSAHYQPLMEAINVYYANKAVEASGLTSPAQLSELAEVLTERYGYPESTIPSTLSLIKQTNRNVNGR